MRHTFFRFFFLFLPIGAAQEPATAPTVAAPTEQLRLQRPPRGPNSMSAM